MTDSWFSQVLTESGIMVLGDRGYRYHGLREKFNIITPKGNRGKLQQGDKEISKARASAERPFSVMKSWEIVRRCRMRWVRHHDIIEAVAVVGRASYVRRSDGRMGGMRNK